MASIEKRTSKEGKVSYRARVRLKGYPAQYATFSRKSDAENWIQDTESAIRNGRHFKSSAAKRHTLSDLITRYLTWAKKRTPDQNRYKDIKQKLEWWDKKLGYCVLADLSGALIAEKLEQLSDTPKKNGKPRTPATVNRYAATLSHALSIAIKEWEWLEHHPMKKLSKMQEPQGRVRYLSEEEKAALLTACQQSGSKYLYIIVVLALSTGMRKGEILNLRWKDVDIERHMIVLNKTKNRERRTLPLKGLALELIKKHRKVRRIDTDLLFPAMKGDKPIDIRESWLYAVDQAKLTDFKFHDLRHTAASYLTMNGATLPELAEILGHKTLAMVKRYAHLSESHTHSVVSRMNERYLGA